MASTFPSQFAKAVKLTKNYVVSEKRISGGSRIIRKTETDEIDTVQRYAVYLESNLHQQYKDKVAELELKFEERVKELESRTQVEMKSIMHSHEKLTQAYTEKIERSCQSIVVSVLDTLLIDMTDKDKVNATVMQAVQGYNNASSAQLLVNTAQYNDIKTDDLPEQWTVQKNDSIGLNTCIVQLPMGDMHFSFGSSIDRVKAILSQSN